MLKEIAQSTFKDGRPSTADIQSYVTGLVEQLKKIGFRTWWGTEDRMSYKTTTNGHRILLLGQSRADYHQIGPYHGEVLDIQIHLGNSPNHALVIFGGSGTHEIGTNKIELDARASMAKSMAWENRDGFEKAIVEWVLHNATPRTAGNLRPVTVVQPNLLKQAP